MQDFFNNRLFLKTTPYFVAGWFFVGILFLIVFSASATSAENQKDNLRRQIDEIQQQIDALRDGILGLRQQGKTLKQEISLLDGKIESAELEIRRTVLNIEKTEAEISDSDLALNEAELKLGRERQILGEYVKEIYEADQRGIPDMILGNEKFSDFFDVISSLQDAQRGIRDGMKEIKRTKADLESGRRVLEDRREEFNQLKVLQEIQRRSLAFQQTERENLLEKTKGQESNYQNLLEKARADAESIKQSLYLLEGVGLSMTLEEAYQHAKKASNLTGIRPAFLLAVLKDESRWGEKVGTGTWRRDMHVRDRDAFIKICQELGLDPDKVSVSRKPSYGWGGAMGPAQFLPSVWQSYKDKVARLTGHNPPSPWNIEDAFVAAGIKLMQAGAVAQNYNAEWKAAQIYFAGSRWNNSAYYFYGDQIMETAAMIQEQLDIIVR